MINSKRIHLITAVALAVALLTVSVLYGLGSAAKANGTSGTLPAYVTQLFGTEIISIEIIADPQDWQTMLDNALSEQFIMADVRVNGTLFQNVGIRPKGNSSLRQVAQSDSDRYSFRLQFDEYIKDQTCFGLESFVVNNILADNSYLKEYVSYDLMQEIGVDAPCFGFADICVNGEGWGLYLAVELYNDSYEQRVFGDTSGMLYNVKSMEMGQNQNNGNAQIPPNGTAQAQSERNGPPDFPPFENGQEGVSREQNGAPPSEDKQADGGIGNPGRGNGGGKNGGSLAYIDDNTASYSAIFNNVVGKGKESDYKRVVEALKALSQERELAQYFDVDQILRYFAAHTIVVNLDSYSSSMAQNYYLYEHNGKLTMLPWDYNLAWGGFQSKSATSVINFPIDTPVSGLTLSERPMLDKLLSNEQYLLQYHSYLQQLIDNYFSDGKFAVKVRQLEKLIDSYVKNDATAFCSYDEYKQAVSALITLGELRAQSVQGQLDGTVPSTTQEQTEHPEQLISAEDLSLSTLGSMGGGKGEQNGALGEQSARQFGNRQGQIEQDRQMMSKARQILQAANGELTDEVTQQFQALGLTQQQIGQLSSFGGERQRQGENDMQGGNTPLPASRGPSIALTVLLLVSLLLATFLVSKIKRKY